jgi:hypothetical protein
MAAATYPTQIVEADRWMQDVVKAVQAIRARAYRAGHLKSTAQPKVIVNGSTIIIEPANPNTVYVREYDPRIVYGAPVVA